MKCTDCYGNSLSANDLRPISEGMVETQVRVVRIMGLEKIEIISRICRYFVRSYRVHLKKHGKRALSVCGRRSHMPAGQLTFTRSDQGLRCPLTD